MVETMDNNGVEPRVQKFEYFEREAKQPSWVFPLRKAGIARFAELGFPTLKDEDWRFTNIAPIAKLPFRPVFQGSRNGLAQHVISGSTFGKLEAIRLVFVNGHYAEDLSLSTRAIKGLSVTSLASALSVIGRASCRE